MARTYLIAGLIGIGLYGLIALFGAEFESTRLNRESPSQARARRAASGGGGFGGGK